MRVQGWESILVEQIESAREIHFKWGTFDCCLWAGDVVLAIAGFDPMAKFRGKYRSENGARRQIIGLGISLEEYISTLFTPIPVAQAQRGDLVFSKGAVGVCAGIESYFISPTGLTALKTLSCLQAWRVE